MVVHTLWISELAIRAQCDPQDREVKAARCEKSYGVVGATRNGDGCAKAGRPKNDDPPEIRRPLGQMWPRRLIPG